MNLIFNGYTTLICPIFHDSLGTITRPVYDNTRENTRAPSNVGVYADLIIVKINDKSYLTVGWGLTDSV